MHNKLEKIKKMVEEDMQENTLTIREEYEKNMHNVTL